MQRFFLSAIAVLVLSMPAAALGADAELRANLFAGTDRLLATARESRAQLLAPRSFRRALDAYRDAEQRFERGQAIAKIQEDLRNADNHFQKAVEAAADMTAALPGTLKARDDALSSGAKENAFEQFATTEEALLELAEDVERGRNRDLTQFDQR